MDLQLLRINQIVLAKDITSTPYADTTGVEATINSASDVIAKLIDSVIKLSGVTNDGADIGNARADANAGDAAVPTNAADVKLLLTM